MEDGQFDYLRSWILHIIHEEGTIQIPRVVIIYNLIYYSYFEIVCIASVGFRGSIISTPMQRKVYKRGYILFTPYGEKKYDLFLHHAHLNLHDLTGYQATLLLPVGF